MYWKLEALTAKRALTFKIIEGSYDDVMAEAQAYDLEILSVTPDYILFVRNLLQGRRLSTAVLADFFKDFANMQKAGNSMFESLNNLSATSPNILLKKALVKTVNYLNDGRSLKEAFEYTKIFPSIVPVTIHAAEKTGCIAELSEILGEYFAFRSENKRKIIKSLIYPCVICCLLSGLSVFISIVLVPQLKALLPSAATNNLSAAILIGYAGFIKEYWYLLIMLLAGGVFLVKHLWDHDREGLMETMFAVPLFGELIKNIELSGIFLNLYVYQKSGINIIQTLDNIHHAHPNYITSKLMVIKELIANGSSLGEAFARDKFFPPLVCQNLLKGQASGYLPVYFERIYKYYDLRSKESISAVVALVEPMLMVGAASFLLMILCAFILPIYTNMNSMGTMGLR